MERNFIIGGMLARNRIKEWLKYLGKKTIEYYITRWSLPVLILLAYLFWDHVKTPIFSLKIYLGYLYVLGLLILFMFYKIIYRRNKKKKQHHAEYSEVKSLPSTPSTDLDDTKRAYKHFLSQGKLTHKYDEAIAKLRENFIVENIKWKWDANIKSDEAIYISNIQMFCPDCDMEVTPSVKKRGSRYRVGIASHYLAVECIDCKKTLYKTDRYGQNSKAIYDIGRKFIERAIRKAIEAESNPPT